MGVLWEGRQSVCVCWGRDGSVGVLWEGWQSGCECYGRDGRVNVLCGVWHVDCINHQPMKADSLLTTRIIQPLSIKIAMFSLME